MRQGSISRFFQRPACAVGRDLIGWHFSVDGVGGAIVETEAYMRDDEASHSFKGRTKSNAAMFGPPATAYVYRIYGLHLCLNVVCEDAGAVLLRALVPNEGQDRMAERRGVCGARLLCSGPGRLAQALAISMSMNGADLLYSPFRLRPPGFPAEIVAGPRIGISRARDKPWRFGQAGSAFLSKPFPPSSLSSSDPKGNRHDPTD